MTSPTPAQETVDRLKPYVLDLLGTTARDQAQQALADTEAIRDAVPGQIATELDLQVPPLIDAGMDEHTATTASTVAGWTADAVGGRNLIPGSSQEPTTRGFTETMHYRDIGEDTLLEVGQEYTFSVIVDKLSDDDHPISIQVGTGTGRNYTRDISHRSSIALGERTIITFTPTEHHLDGRTHFAWRIRNDQKATTVAYREVKLERGPRATPWTPAPEDAAQHVQAGNPLSSFPSPFPAHDPALSLRVDNSVGTRVFAGDTVIYGDTGWRRLDALVVAENFISGNLAARRRGNTVELIGYNIRAHADSTDLKMFVTLPQGFLPAFTARYGSSYWGKRWNITPHGVLNLGQSTGNDYFNVMFTTHDSWPTTLPGTPA